MTQPPSFTPITKANDPLSRTEALDYLEEVHQWKISPATLYNWISHGRRGIKLEVGRRGGNIYFTKEGLDAFISAHD